MQDSKEIVIAPGADVFTGPVGTAFPDDPTEDVDVAFTELGLIGEDGAKFNYGITVGEVKAAQKRVAVRRFVTDEEMLSNFSLEQFNAHNWALAFGGGEFVETKPGIYTYEFPGGDEALNEQALLLRWLDGDRHYQLGIDRGNVTEGVEIGLKRSEAAMIPISYKALAADGQDTIGVIFCTDDVAFEPAGS
jgi:hypothetical protein